MSAQCSIPDSASAAAQSMPMIADRRIEHYPEATVL